MAEPAVNILRSILVFVLVVFTSITLLSAEEKTEKSSQPNPIFVFSGKEGVTPFGDDEGTRKILRRVALRDEGRALERKGLFEEAIAKYKEAMHPSLLNRESDAFVSKGALIDVYAKIRKYELALELAEERLRWKPESPHFQDSQRELEALIKARDTGSNEPIYEHIAYLRKKWKKFLPPKTSDSIQASTIIRLYDYIGDYDAGIAFVDGALAYIESYDRKKFGGLRSFNSAHKAYLKVKEAFERDKAEGRESCTAAKPGEVCMGRATKALIQSDYFPW